MSIKDKITSTYIATFGHFFSVGKGPDEVFGRLFRDVQSSGIYGDGKDFADMVPRNPPELIKKEYALLKNDPSFDLGEFLTLHFYGKSTKNEPFTPRTDALPHQYISDMWQHLEHKHHSNEGSLVALPNKYIVPGGRFSEQFYWDSYFIMLGLSAEGKWSEIEGMIKNCAYMIRKFGYIPTANRTYFLSRSQPPVFVLMIRLLALHKGRKRVCMEYLPYLLAEYKFWTKGRPTLQKKRAKELHRVALLPDDSILNRYYDDKSTPRPESLQKDTETSFLTKRKPSRLFLDLRAGAESGWDFSSRWFDVPNDIRTIRTTDYIPVDLNSLLYMLEETIAEAYGYILQPLLSKHVQQLADKRRQSLLKYCWDENNRFFVDYDFKNKRQSPHLTLAGVLPLYAKLATQEQAAAVAGRLEQDFLKPGGLVTTLYATGQQWDAPNGWAPLHWFAIEGLQNYGYYKLADEIKRRWLKTNFAVFRETGKFVEKYDVINGTVGGGGEYTLQEGFGWTNGVLEKLLEEDSRV